MTWPQSLITELAARRCIIFLGSGASAGSKSQDGSKNPSTWKAFLQNLLRFMRSQDDIGIINQYISVEKYLEAAEIIVENVPKADFSRFIREELEIPRFAPSRIHEIVLKIDPKIVITTNFDTIYDTYCTSGTAIDGYHVSKYYEEHISTDLKSPVRLIIKAHGCVTNPDKIVLTKSQFFKARQDYSNFYKILDALFLTHTILFLGYSLADPDIQLVLENVNISAPTPHPHYFVTSGSLHPSIKAANQRSYNLEFLEFPQGDYGQLNNSLEELLTLVHTLRIDNPSV